MAGASVRGRADRQADYETTLLNPYVAAERGFVDMVIDPAETRAIVADCLLELAAIDLAGATGTVPLSGRDHRGRIHRIASYGSGT